MAKTKTFYMFNKRTDGGMELMLVEGHLARKTLVVGSGEDAVKFPLSFDALQFLLGDIFLAIFNKTTREITPIAVPESPVDPTQDPGLLTAVTGQVQHLLDGTKEFEAVTKEVDTALKAKSLNLIQATKSKVDEVGAKWADVAGNLIPAKVQVNFVAAFSAHAPWYVPVTLANGTRSHKTRAFADSGADLQLIEPAVSKKLSAPVVGRTSVISVDGGESIANVVAVDVTINGGKRQFYAAEYPGLKARVKSDFLLSRGGMEWADGAGLAHFPPK